MTEFSRRHLSRLAASILALPVVSRSAFALGYPTRPVRIVVGYAAGGAADIVARLIGQWLSDRLGQPFIIENRPGAASNVGTEAVVRSTPDGYTLLLFSNVSAFNAALYDNLTFNFLRDIALVASVSGGPLVMEVNPSFPAKTVSEFIAYAKANPGKVNFASAGIGDATHVAAELFKMMTGVSMVNVTFRSSPSALTEMMGGRVQVMFDTLSSSIELIKAGKLRALGVTTATRSAALPDVPTVAEFVTGYEATQWNGVGAPRNTPAEIISKLNNEINAALADPTIKARLAELGSAPLPGSPVDCGKLLAEDTEKWSKVIRAANIKPE
jgi:tripartite-type tricarboxylate transporter receptor subunit TctC